MPHSVRACRLTLLAACACALVGLAAAAPVTPATTDAKQAYLEGVRLARAGEALASLPWFLRARALRPDLWQVHMDLSSALANASLESRAGAGAVVPAVRSTRVRVAMWRAAVVELDEAERLAPDANSRADVQRLRAENYVTWGLGLDAMEAVARAMETDPTSAETARAAREYLDLLRQPVAR